MRKGTRSICPIACTLDLIGDRWTLLVIRDLACGKSQFKEFCSSPEKIATNILTERLGRLLESGIVERFQLPGQLGRDAYRLTEKGRSLGPVLKAIADWGLQHIEGTKARMNPRF